VAWDVVVVGGGVAGLVAARGLAAADRDVLVLEGSPQVGGKLRSAEVAGLTVDVGAEAMLARRPEGLALAALWKLPVVFICENNLYSMGTPLHRSMSVLDVSQKALAYGMARDRFEGEDVVKVRDRVSEAVRRARNESLPTLIEIITYRYRGHSMSDAGLYRTKDEVEEWKQKRDPVTIGRELCQKAGVDEKEITAIEEGVKAEIEEAVKFADESGELTYEELEQFTYKE
jgi:pyruvate dehydrogenase E1 component alpha subunit